MYIHGNNVNEIINNISEVLTSIKEWLRDNYLCINIAKYKFITVDTRYKLNLIKKIKLQIVLSFAGEI